MQVIIAPSRISGTRHAPASKSLAQRAIALASFAEGMSEIANVGNSDDVLSAIRVCRALGAKIDIQPNKLLIEGRITPPNAILDCGESGLGTRMFSCLAATLNNEVVLAGNGSLVNRPMTMIEQSVRGLGAFCVLEKGGFPIRVKGPLTGGKATIDGSVSSQALTGMLMAAPLAQNDTTIFVSNLRSKHYIDLTLETMNAFGVQAENRNYSEFFIKGQQRYTPAVFNVEGDWSGAAFLLVAGAIAGNVRVENLNPMSKQPDKKIMEALMFAGARVSIHYDFIEVSEGKLNPFHFDATHCPDLFPPLVALAAHCQGESRILGVSRLRAKESDRAATLQQEFSKLGIRIDIQGEMMSIFGGTFSGGKVQSHNDHRIVMACATAALCGSKTVEIFGADSVRKSYPEFYDNLKSLGATILIVE